MGTRPSTVIESKSDLDPPIGTIVCDDQWLILSVMQKRELDAKTGNFRAGLYKVQRCGPHQTSAQEVGVLKICTASEKEIYRRPQIASHPELFPKIVSMSKDEDDASRYEAQVVMEELDGTLRTLSDRVDLKQAAITCVQALSILHVQMQVLHCDVAPENIGVRHDGVVLIDYGRATVAPFFPLTADTPSRSAYASIALHRGAPVPADLLPSGTHDVPQGANDGIAEAAPCTDLTGGKAPRQFSRARSHAIDDLESLLYVILEQLAGELPWSHIHPPTDVPDIHFAPETLQLIQLKMRVPVQLSHRLADGKLDAPFSRVPPAWADVLLKWHAILCKYDNTESRNSPADPSMYESIIAAINSIP